MPERRTPRRARQRRKPDPAREAAAKHFFTSAVDEALARAALTRDPVVARAALEQMASVCIEQTWGVGDAPVEMVMYGHTARQLQRLIDVGLIQDRPKSLAEVQVCMGATVEHTTGLREWWTQLPAEDRLIVLWDAMWIEMKRDETLAARWLPSLGQAVY